MRKIIHHLRRQPEEVRRHILHIIIFVLAVIMLILWGFSLGKNLANPDTEARMKQDLQPFSALKDSITK
jgi:hypothetical protein